jgi:hypothetical protein
VDRRLPVAQATRRRRARRTPAPAPHQADSDDDRDLWMRRHRYMARRYGKRQIEQRSEQVIADLLDALEYAAAGIIRPADARRSARS